MDEVEESQLNKRKIQNSNNQPKTKTARFKCQKCENTYLTARILKVHKKIAHEKKRFKCEYCKKLFSRKDILEIHERIHTNEKPFDCNYCQAKFRSKPNLVCHERVHTNERPYECERCQARFKTKHVLSKHKKSKTACVFHEKTNVRQEFYNNNERQKPGKSSKSQEKDTVKNQNAKETFDKFDDNEEDW